MGKKCLKCGYERSGVEDAPEYECPKCGAVYAKVEAALQNKQKPKPQKQKPSALRAKSSSSNGAPGVNNAKVARCKTCGKEVAVSAKTCPHCGQKHPAITTKDAILGFGMLAAVVWIISLFVGGDSDTTTGSRAKEARGERTWSERQVAGAEVVLDKDKCRSAAANKWLLDYTMEHGVTSEAQKMEAIRQVVIFNDAIRTFCADDQIIWKIQRAAIMGEIPGWIRPEVNVLVRAAGARLK